MKTLPGARHEDPQFRSPENQRVMEEFFSEKLGKREVRTMK
jgi:hypothetical protein